MQVAEFAEFGVCVQALVRGEEREDAEGRPVVLSKGGGAGFFAEEGELVEGEGVLAG